MAQQYLEFRGINKAFPGVQALQDISFKINGGEVTALIGENGAGKSTLLKVLSGDIVPDTGELIISGNQKQFAHPLQAIKSGISVIYQERQLVPMMSVMENIFIDDLPSNKLGIINNRELKRKAEKKTDLKLGCLIIIVPILPQRPETESWTRLSGEKKKFCVRCRF